MVVIAFDTETALIRPGCLAPELVCTTWSALGEAGIRLHTEAVEPFEKVLQDGHILVGHNIAYDMAVMAAYAPALLPAIFAAYEAGNVRDTMIQEQLIDIANGTFKKKRLKKGSYSLATLAKNYLGVELDKGTWRMGYADLRDTLISEWPAGAIDYAMEDARTTLAVYTMQGAVVDSAAQARADFALHLMSCYGMRTDAENVAVFGKEVIDTIARCQELLVASGLMDASGKKNTKVISDRVFAALGNDAPTTPTGKISTAAETIELCDDPDLAVLVEYNQAQKLESTWLEPLQSGIDLPIQPHYHVLVESGRTSCSGPAIQTLHRATGLRECFAPRRGYLYASCDYTALEMCTLGQVCIDLGIGSKLAEAINGGLDPHLHVAAQLLHTSYVVAHERYKAGDKETRKARQLAKALNFGLPGGLGPLTFVQYAKGYGVIISEQESRKLKDAWMSAWPEMFHYFEHINHVVGMSTGTVKQLRSNRLRGNVGYTQACNTYFQGLAADGAKLACFNVAKACYVDQASPLFGSRPVAMIHDQILAEVPIDRAPEAADELACIMRQSMSQYTPDVTIRAEVCLMSRWFKDAETVRDTEGVLQVWSPPSP